MLHYTQLNVLLPKREALIFPKKKGSHTSQPVCSFQSERERVEIFFSKKKKLEVEHYYILLVTHSIVVEYYTKSIGEKNERSHGSSQ